MACSVLSPHSFRHTYRAWLDELDTPITVQQRAMRHGDIRVTMNYGDAIGEGLREATAKVAARAIPHDEGAVPGSYRLWTIQRLAASEVQAIAGAGTASVLYIRLT